MKTDFEICKQISLTTDSPLNSKLSRYFREGSVNLYECVHHIMSLNLKGPCASGMLCDNIFKTDLISNCMKIQNSQFLKIAAAKHAGCARAFK